MSQDTWPHGSDAFADLARRRDALRHAAAMPGADSRALLEATFAELDAAVDAMTKLMESDPGSADPTTAGGPVAGSASLSAERGLLRAVFQNAPAPLFLLEPDGTIRRANARAGDLIGAPSGYATGRPMTAFIDLPSRAAVQSQLAAAARTGTARQADCKLLSAAGPVDATMTANVVALPDGSRLLVVTVAELPGHPGAGLPRDRGGEDTAPPTGLPRPESTGSAVQTMTRRMDMVTAVTRLLLDNSTFSEAVTLQRCARLLAGDIASWVIVDIERADRLRRQFVIGPHDEAQEDLARKARTVFSVLPSTERRC